MRLIIHEFIDGVLNHLASVRGVDFHPSLGVAGEDVEQGNAAFLEFVAAASQDAECDVDLCRERGGIDAGVVECR